MSMDELLSLLREGRQAEAVDGLAAGRGGWRWHQLEAFGHALDRLPAGLEPAQAGFVASACVTVLSSGTAFPLVGGLAGLLASHRIASRPVDTGYDQWRFGLLRPGVGARPPGTLPHVRVHLCLLDAGVVHPRMALGEALDDTLRRLDTSWQDIASLVDGFLAAGGEHLVLNTIPVPREHLDVVLDFRGKARLARAWCEFNARLLSLAEGDPRIVVLDTASALQDALPDGRFWDARLAARARVQWTPAALAALADAYARTIRALLGQARKCLVTDLDGTLWEGVLGDDGIDGLGIEDGEAGNAHLRLQQAVAALGRQGVILAVNSKNDHERVVQGLQSRAMPLRAGEIACLVANWRPKDENMSHIASQLDIGLDSMVFLDDSRFEREIVRRRHPAVEVVEPGDDPALFVGRLLRAGLFDRPAVTAEDRGRNRSYAAATGQAARGPAGGGDLPAYLSTLALRARVLAVDARHAERVAQLTQRTNQFNLGGLRLGAAELLARAGRADTRDLAFSLRSVHEDQGIVGAALGGPADGQWTITNLVLSCRAFSRHLEHFMLARLADAARAAGCGTLVGLYAPSARNQRFERFYLDAGFDEDAPAGPVRRFRLDLSRPVPAPAWIQDDTPDEHHHLPA